MAARMSCGQLAADNPSSAKRRSSCLVSMSLARWMRTQEAAQLPPAGHESSHSELRASPDRKSLFKYEFDDIRVVSDPCKAVPLNAVCSCSCPLDRSWDHRTKEAAFSLCLSKSLNPTDQ